MKSDEAHEGLVTCDASVHALMLAIKDRFTAMAEQQIPVVAAFPTDEYFAFVKAWDEYRWGNEKRKAWFFSPAETLDRVKVYWDLNAKWRKRAEHDIGLAPLVEPEVGPPKPPPPGDPSRKLPYEDAITAGLVVAGIYLIARIVGK